ncbi:MAG: GNAT family N-acetyltransferase [Bacteroides sp.]|nr:GNAT family N-acetyltransferase [Bacteroides sp.]MDD4721060.1 GNAT family N-acetyltransferase [Bacteroides sp.]
MERNKIREQLTLKPVSLKYIDQFNELLRYVFQVTNSELEESGYEDGEIIKAKRPILQNAEVFGWFNKDQLVSQICIYPCQVNIHGKIFQMGGITGVGTYPEYTNMGLMSDLIRRSLEKMKESQQLVSYLYPYSIPYYRRKGWEIMSDHITFKIKDTQIPDYNKIKGFVEREDVDHPDVLKVYDQFAHSNHGALVRSQLEWEEYWRWDNEEERIAAIYYNMKGEPTGYLFYWISDDIFHIMDMVYLNQEARKGLWNFVKAHDSMIDEVQGHIYKNETLAFLLDDSQITETIEPYFMARIVDVEDFLLEYPFRELETIKPFHFVISDPLAKWNEGIFSIHANKKGKVQVSREKIGKPVTIDIQTLTCMLLSYRRPYYLHKIERLKTDSETLGYLQRIIPNEQPYFGDYF